MTETIADLADRFPNPAMLRADDKPVMEPWILDSLLENGVTIHFRDELGPTRRRSGHQQQLMLQKATHSRRRLLSKQGQGGTAAVSYA